MQNFRGQSVPENFEEALKEIRGILLKSGEGNLEKFINETEDDLSEYHHSLGRLLRNKWGLWGNSDLKKFMEKQGFTHADDMSSALILFTHREENGVLLEIEKKVAEYKAYWANMEEVEEK